MSLIDSNFILLFSISGMFCLALIEYFFTEIYRNKVKRDWQDRFITIGLSGFVILSVFELVEGIVFASILVISFILLIYSSRRYDLFSKVYIISTSIIFIVIYYFFKHWIIALITPVTFFPVYYFYKKK